MREGRRFFTDERWALVACAVGGRFRPNGQNGGETLSPAVDRTRSLIEAVVWIARSGAPWRDLSTRFGPWERVYRRYRRWVVAGRWEAREAIAGCLLLIDSTIVKAHPHAAGARARHGAERAAEALGRSRGGFSTKLHALVTERGELVRYSVADGEAHDITQARGLVGASASSPKSYAVVGDCAYDSDAFVEHLVAAGMHAVIPARANRKEPRELDASADAQRNVIERWFGRMKAYRRVATRYDKTASSYLGFVALPAMLVVLTGWPG